jgi:hypothetical protein
MRVPAAGCVALLAVLLAGCRGPLVVETGGGASGTGGGTPREWTVAVYMAADNELEAAALSDLNEMEAAPATAPGVTTVVLIDRAAGYTAADGDWTDTRLYEVRPDPLGKASPITSTRLASTRLGLDAGTPAELDTARAETLAAFLAFARERFPARHTALVLWGAGSGYRAVSIDEAAGGDPLATGELREALAEAAPDVVGLDLNFGAGIETAVELAPFAETLVSSQETVGTAGWDYRALLERLSAEPAGVEAFGEAAVAAFAASYAATPGACISVVELEEVAAVSEALNGLSDGLHTEAAGEAEREELRQTLFSEVEDFYRTPGELYLDLGDLAAVVSRRYPAVGAAANGLLRAVGGAVRRSWCAEGANGAATGLSVHYVPVDAGGYAYPPHADDYFAGRVVPAPLRFVSDSRWVPDEIDGDGLLYRLWYEAM